MDVMQFFVAWKFGPQRVKITLSWQSYVHVLLQQDIKKNEQTELEIV